MTKTFIPISPAPAVKPFNEYVIYKQIATLGMKFHSKGLGKMLALAKQVEREGSILDKLIAKNMQNDIKSISKQLTLLVDLAQGLSDIENTLLDDKGCNDSPFGA